MPPLLLSTLVLCTLLSLTISPGCPHYLYQLPVRNSLSAKSGHQGSSSCRKHSSYSDHKSCAVQAASGTTWCSLQGVSPPLPQKMTSAALRVKAPMVGVDQPGAAAALEAQRESQPLQSRLQIRALAVARLINFELRHTRDTRKIIPA